jgi:hypothetical protein
MASDLQRFVQPIQVAIFGQQVDQLSDVVTGVEKQRTQRLIDADLQATYPVQHAFSNMGELNDGHQAKQAGRTFDGVGHPEQAIDGVHVEGRLLDLQQRVFHLQQQLATFSDEGLQHVVHVHRLGHGIRLRSIGR